MSNIEISATFKLIKILVYLINFDAEMKLQFFDNYNVPLTPNGFGRVWYGFFLNILSDYIQITFSQVEGYI